MKLLTSQARRFAWKPFSKTLDDAPDPGPEREAIDCVVAFIHAETRDIDITASHRKEQINQRYSGQ